MANESFPDNFGSTFGAEPELETTGRFLVLLDDDAQDESVAAFRENAGLHVARSADFESAAFGLVSDDGWDGAEGIVLDNLGVAIIEGDPDQMNAVNLAVSASGGSLLEMEPERVVYALQDMMTTKTDISTQATYLEGYRDGVQNLVNALLNGSRSTPQTTGNELGTSEVWGLHATGVLNSPFSGQGVKIAVLDTGLDLDHPDFAGRVIQHASFIAGEEVQDGHGHGTHCVGTACGSVSNTIQPRYGIAHNAEIFAGKVLSNQGRGADGGILTGINWAISQGCDIVSMSLGARPGPSYSRVYEQAARRALRQGVLIVAAAGNDSRRHLGISRPVAHPANCPSILAVAAIDANMRVAHFSNQGTNATGGQVDIVAPGVDVYSSWPMDTRYRSISGTSMATPHVAGIAALYLEQEPNIRGCNLWMRLLQMARRLPLASEDVGAGLVQAP